MLLVRMEGFAFGANSLCIFFKTGRLKNETALTEIETKMSDAIANAGDTEVS